MLGLVRAERPVWNGEQWRAGVRCVSGSVRCDRASNGSLDCGVVRASKDAGQAR